MSFRRLGSFPLLILAFSIPSYAQSLGEVAREVRAERQEKGSPPLKVITNDDIESTEPAPVASSPAGAAQATSSAKRASKSPKGGNDSAKEGEEQELETQKRTDEINKAYLDGIAALRLQIDGAQKEVAKLQRDQLESTYAFQRSVGSSPSIVEYEQQQRLFNDQIEAQRSLIDGLKAKLEDAQEAARHAGVPHPYD